MKTAAFAAVPLLAVGSITAYEVYKTSHSNIQQPQRDDGRVTMSPDCICHERRFKNGMTLIYE
jgi:hypothetical protein